MRNIITAIALSGLLGCSPAPKNVKPLPVAAGSFSGLSCPALLAKRGHVDQRVADLSKSQRSSRNGDIVGVALLGLPVGRMAGGNVAGELGKAKGEQIAVNDEIAARGC